VPLLSGSGTRIKILEAWAAGTAVVSTPLGAQGLCCGGAIRLSALPEFASSVLQLLDDEPERRRLAAAGRAVYESKFHSEAAWNTLDAAGIL
jgi:hypothetical protein